jgi:NMD protein affecting ribosome stability and mRNA decay
MTDFPFDASGRCPACGDLTDEDSLLCDDCMEMVRNDPRTGQPNRVVERTCESCGQPADSFGWCEGMRLYMDCFYAKRVMSDREFLTACGIVPFTVLAQGTVYIKIEMARKFVLKHKKNRNRKHAGRRRKSAFRPKMGEYAI